MSDEIQKDRPLEVRPRQTPYVLTEQPTGTQVIANTLVPQMGSSGEFLQKNKLDDRKFAVLNPTDLVTMGYFEYRFIVDGQRFFGHMVHWFLNASPSVGGLARRQVIQTVEASRGGSGLSARDFAKKPNIVARHTTRKNWKQEAEERGQIVVE